MKRMHAALISLLLGAATVAGVFALERTVSLGPSTPDASKSIAVRQAQLDQVAAQIRALRKASPPRLAAAEKKQSAPAQVLYVRASAPTTAAAGEREDEQEHEGEGGGFDD
jgi:hypothetical protein